MISFILAQFDLILSDRYITPDWIFCSIIFLIRRCVEIITKLIHWSFAGNITRKTHRTKFASNIPEAIFAPLIYFSKLNNLREWTYTKLIRVHLKPSQFLFIADICLLKIWRFYSGITSAPWAKTIKIIKPMPGIHFFSFWQILRP